MRFFASLDSLFRRFNIGDTSVRLVCRLNLFAIRIDPALIDFVAFVAGVAGAPPFWVIKFPVSANVLPAVVFFYAYHEWVRAAVAFHNMESVASR